MWIRLWGVFVVATSAGCATARPHIVQADEALVAGAALDAGNHYFAVWREARRTGDEAMEERAYEGVRNATHAMLLPLFQRAEALVDQGAGAAVAELLSDLYLNRPFTVKEPDQKVQAPGFQEGRHVLVRGKGYVFFTSREVIEGTEALMAKAVAQAIGMDLGAESATIDESMVLLRLLVLRVLGKKKDGEYRRHEHVRQRMAVIFRHLVERGIEEIEKAIARKEWASARRAAHELQRVAKSERPRLLKLREQAQDGFAALHRELALEYSSSAPGRAAMHAVLATHVGLEDERLAALRTGVQFADYGMSIKSISGACSTEAQAAFRGAAEPTGKPEFVVEIQLDECAVTSEPRVRKIREQEPVFEKVTRTGYVGEPILGPRDSCVKETYCLVSPPGWARKSYTWKCPPSSVRTHNKCTPQERRVGTRWVKRQHTFTKKTWRQYTRSVPYTVHGYKVRGLATIRPPGAAAIAVRLDDGWQTENRSLEEVRAALQWSLRDKVHSRIRNLESAAKTRRQDMVESAWKADRVDEAMELESRELLQRKDDWPITDRFAEALGTPAWMIASALHRKKRLDVTLLRPPTFPDSVRVGPPTNFKCYNVNTIGQTPFRSIADLFRFRLVCPVLRNLGYTEATWAAEVTRLRPQLEVLPPDALR